jgi:hypothetical protein
MNVIDFLKHQSDPFGVGHSAPDFIWWAAVSLVLIPLYLLIQLFLQVRKESKSLERIVTDICQIQSQYPVIASRGLSTDGYDRLVQLFSTVPSLKHAWNSFDSLVVRRRNATGEDECWATETAGLAFSDALVFERGINRGFYAAVPGIVTGLGLLCTFLAILVALLDVRIGQNNQVEGLHGLISGLSGKFISSIAALLSATIFTVFERLLLPRLWSARLQLVESLDALIPRLSPVRVLAEVQRDIAEQSVAFRSFNADLSLKLKRSFSESMGPTTERMVNAIEELNRLLRAAETQKQETITGSLEGMLRNLERSITTTLEGMGERFKESLSASTMNEFGKVTDSLGGTARLLESMNVQSQVTQSSLKDLVNLAKSSTVEQMALGKSQVEDLTLVLRQFMSQMNETAGSSVTRMASTLTAVVNDLSHKVEELSQSMATTMQENSEKATSAAAVVVEQAETWSAKSAEQMEQLVQQHQSHLQNVKDVETALISALGLFNNSLGQYAALNGDLRVIASEVSTTAAAATGATRTMQEAQKTVEQVAAFAAAQLDRLEEGHRSQRQVWESISKSMEQYKNVFSQTEKASGELLNQLSRNLRSHMDVTRQGYEHLIGAADNHFSNATQKLGASVNELDEHLQGLTEFLERVGKINNGRGS